MKALFFKICLSLVALVFSASAGFSLPACPSTGYFHNCFGTYTFASGDKYVGEWQDNSAHGQGTKTYANGSKYVGEYQDGEYHGQGTYTYANGTIERGYYMRGEFVPEICEGMGLSKGTEAFGNCVVKLIDKIN